MTSEPIPRPFAILASLAAALFLLPLVGLLVRFPFGDAIGALTSPEIVTAAWLSLVTSLSATALSILLGVPLAIVYPRAHDAADGFAARRRWCRAAGGIRPARARGSIPGLGVRDPHSLHHLGRGPRRDVRRDALPRPHGGGGSALDGSPL